MRVVGGEGKAGESCGGSGRLVRVVGGAEGW